MITIGQQLQDARLALDLSVEDVAFRTRIPASRVRDMESDDLSQFANLTYARGFLKLYSQFLGLDISEHLSQFSTAEFSHASGHEYVQTANATMNLPAAVFTDYGQARRPGLYILILLALTAGGVFWWNKRGEETSGGADKAVIVPAKEEQPAPRAETKSPPPAEAPGPSPVVPAPAVPAPAAPVVPDTAENATEPPAPPPPKPPKAIVVEEVEGPGPPPKREN